jgi:hypothetical protein
LCCRFEELWNSRRGGEIITIDYADIETQEEVRQEVRQIIQECKWTDKLQRLVDYGNSYILKSFHLRLEMEEVTK